MINEREKPEDNSSGFFGLLGVNEIEMILFLTDESRFHFS